MNPIKKLRGLFASKTHILPIYTQQVAYINQASSALVRMTGTTDPAEWKKLEKEVKLCETQGDAMLTEFYEQLYEGIFTPIDRIDLQDNVKANFSNLTLQCDRITELEHAADDAYEEYIGYVFHNEKNPIELMKYKNIAEMFESTTDAAKKVSDYVRKMLLRYTE